MRYDKETIIKLISELNKSLALLEDLSKTKRETFVKDPHLVSSAKYNFVICIEAIIDISNHLISKNKYRAPEDYSDCFAVLQENSLMDSQYASTLKKMAKFRNRLVHIYWELDAKKIHQILKENLVDIKRFWRINFYVLYKTK